MSVDQVRKFYSYTFEDKELQKRLIETQNLDEFVSLAVKLGNDLGYSFSVENMLETMDGLIVSADYEEVDDEWPRKILQIGWVPFGYTRQ